MVMEVDQFKARLIGGGARANLFKVRVNFPPGVSGNVDLTSYMCKAASLPASVISPIEIPFRGRKLKIAGDREFEPWTITVINDTNFAVRNAFESWMNLINGHTSNFGQVNPLLYQADLAIDQLDKNGVTVKTYDMRGCFPTNVSAIDVSYDSENTIEEFTVELQVQYWTSNTTI